MAALPSVGASRAVTPVGHSSTSRLQDLSLALESGKSWAGGTNLHKKTQNKSGRLIPKTASWHLLWFWPISFWISIAFLEFQRFEGKWRDVFPLCTLQSTDCRLGLCTAWR